MKAKRVLDEIADDKHAEERKKKKIEDK